MKNNRLNTIGIALINIKNSFVRSTGMIFMITILSFVLFGGNLLIQSLSIGLNNMKERLGADIMIVPLENEADLEAVLLKGEPGCFYFSRTLEQKVAGVDGVNACTSQFYLTSLNAECCDTKVQIIGFDPDTDFVVQPWISQVYDGNLQEGAVVIGSDIKLENGTTIKLFGTEYALAAKLDATGTGLDQAVYANMDTILNMYADAKEKGQGFLEEADPETSISTILVKTVEGTDRTKIIRNIRKELGGVKVVESQNMISGTAANMKQISLFLYLFAGLFLLTSIGTLFIIFSIMINERKKEFAILRTVGATKKKVVCILLSESVMISSIGGVIGALIASVIIFPFHVYIGDKLGMPYLLPTIGTILLILLIDLVISVLIGPASSAASAVKISRAETFLTMREGE